MGLWAGYTPASALGILFFSKLAVRAQGGWVRMNRDWFLPWTLLAALLSGCGGSVNLAQRRVEYDSVLMVPAQVQTVLAAKTALYDGLLTRTSSAALAPYPALHAYLAAMTVQAAALQSIEGWDGSFKGDFDFFAATHTVVTPQQSGDWAALKSLDKRYPPIRDAIVAHQKLFNDAAGRFDDLAKASDIFYYDGADLADALGALRSDLDVVLKRMEARVLRDSQAVSFDVAVTGMDPTVIAQHQAILGSMQEHLFKTEDLMRRILKNADDLQASCPVEAALWAGPGLPDDGSALGKLWRMRDAFGRRRVEFKSLAESFDAVGQPGANVRPSGTMP